MSQIYLITGERRTGKTTATRSIVEAIGPTRCGGFYTEEVREDGHRVGFRIVTIDGETRNIADVRLDSPTRVEIYGVDVPSFESVAVKAVSNAIQYKEIVVIDEIGPMQLFSDEFKRVVNLALEDSRIFLGTVVLRPHPWTDALKARQGIHLVELATENRERVVRQLTEALRDRLTSRNHP